MCVGGGSPSLSELPRERCKGKEVVINVGCGTTMDAELIDTSVLQVSGLLCWNRKQICKGQPSIKDECHKNNQHILHEEMNDEQTLGHPDFLLHQILVCIITAFH